MLRAPCHGRHEFAPPAGQELTLSDAESLLALCSDCPFRTLCIQRVQPARALFDGVCGGRLWRNGTVVASVAGTTPLELDEGDRHPLCGTVAGYRAHLRLDQPACRACKQAVRDYVAWRRSLARTSRLHQDSDHHNEEIGDISHE